MPEFLRLSHQEQAEILSKMSADLGRSAEVLEKDYEEMKSAGMFDQEPPGFDEIIEELADVENRVNSR